ncbi:MAG: carbamoyltransferase C-terminal domain-containing protein [archaeon]|nr:carbamoyltransferase C-terminal domain-containing protein [archaeon]
MYVLGLSVFVRGSSACLLKDGRVLSAAHEERFSRKKGDCGFPYGAIEFCLDSAGILINDVDCVGFCEGAASCCSLRGDSGGWVALGEKELICSDLPASGQAVGVLRDELKYKGRIERAGHYAAHGFGSYFGSLFDDAALVVVDDAVDRYCTVVGCAKGGDVSFLKAIRSPNSLAALYRAVCDYLGFPDAGSEYKVMGLSAYGRDVFCDGFSRVVEVSGDGYVIDMSFFDFVDGRFVVSNKFVELFGARRKVGGRLVQRHKDIAASLQRVLEDAFLSVLEYVRAVSGCDNLCMSGEVALNCLASGRVFCKAGFKSVYILPAPDAGGLAVGAAFYVYYSVFGQRKRVGFGSPFLGPSFSDEYIKDFLEREGVKYAVFRDDGEMVSAVARLIYEGNVVGWFQGRMEWGARALGARSILASPCGPGVRDVLNLRVKHREGFRPFAPVVCEDDARDFFVLDDALFSLYEFMLAVCMVRVDKRKQIPGAVHADGTARVQVLRRSWNPLFYELVKEFGKLSGVPVLINTSFNDAGEPIVCRPEDAYRCMMRTGVGYVVIGRFLVKKEENLW